MVDVFGLLSTSFLEMFSVSEDSTRLWWFEYSITSELNGGYNI